jgi:hypothetical protein
VDLDSAAERVELKLKLFRFSAGGAWVLLALALRRTPAVPTG